MLCMSLGTKNGIIMLGVKTTHRTHNTQHTQHTAHKTQDTQDTRDKRVLAWLSGLPSCTFAAQLMQLPLLHSYERFIPDISACKDPRRHASIPPQKKESCIKHGAIESLIDSLVDSLVDPLIEERPIRS